MKLDKWIIVHTTHLDVGFAELAANLERQYLEDFIPAALNRARSMNRERALTVVYSGTYGNVTVAPGLSTGSTFLHTI